MIVTGYRYEGKVIVPIMGGSGLGLLYIDSLESGGYDSIDILVGRASSSVALVHHNN